MPKTKEFMPFHFPDQKPVAQVFGGPFRNFSPERRLTSVRMAQGINMKADVVVPTHDFSVPSLEAMHQGMTRALEALMHGHDLYVGCMGGTGRTGLFMACLAKVNMEWFRAYGREWVCEVDDPVAFVRASYRPHAVETKEQEKFVGRFDVSSHVIELLSSYKVIERIVTVEVPVEKIVYREVEKITYPGVIDYIKARLFG